MKSIDWEWWQNESILQLNCVFMSRDEVHSVDTACHSFQDVAEKESPDVSRMLAAACLPNQT